MSIPKLAIAIFVVVLLSAGEMVASAEMTDQAAREQARQTVRSQLLLKPDHFLGVQRDETLEETLALAVGKKPAFSVFFYKVSPQGDEIKEDAVVHHMSTDADLIYMIGISTVDRSIYRIHGFGDSSAEFEKLMKAAGLKVSSAEQAATVADFYRRVNPESLPLTPISSLIEFKQAAERQCQTSSFEIGEKAFDAWWKRAKALYARVHFRQTANPRGTSYLVDWIVLSSAAPRGNCGGAPLRAQLEVRPDGHVGKLTFSPLKDR